MAVRREVVLFSPQWLAHGRPAAAEGDFPDIVFLIRHLGLKNERALMELVGQYHPQNRIPMRAHYLVDGLLEERKA